MVICKSVGLWVLSLVLILQEAECLRVLSDSTDAWSQLLSDLPNLDGDQFRDGVAKPLALMCQNAYQFPELQDVAGWVPARLVEATAPEHGGMHAIVYEESDGQRIVVAFRGTQLKDTEDRAADVCADELLWGDDAPRPDGVDCSNFDKETLDYFSAAVHYILEVEANYPDKSLLLTGHGTGAGLAILVSAALSTYPAIPVVAFGAPGTKAALETRNLRLNAESENRVFIIASQWDEVMRTTWDKQMGILCLYGEKESTACVKCFGSEASPVLGRLELRRSLLHNKENLGLDYCKLCFLQTHYMSKLLRTINQGIEPVCQAHT